MKNQDRIALVEQAFRHEFRDKNLLTQACTHSSLKNSKSRSYEVLEFLGDAVFLSIITDIIVREYPNVDEGKLSKIRSQLVTNQNLSTTIEAMGVVEALKMIKGQKATPSILSDFFEAIIGAIYLDGGMNSAFFSVRKIYENHWKELSIKNTDFKSQFQEVIQKKLKVNPRYKTVETEGKPHDLTFTVAVTVNNEIMALGKGKSKKQAEQMGAKSALEKMKKTTAK